MNKIPNSYLNSSIQHEKVEAIRQGLGKLPPVEISGKAAGWTNLNLDWKQSDTLYPEGFPYYVRGRDSLRTYITKLFTSEITLYDGAMGTMIQNYAKKNKLEEEEYRGERFADWKCNVKGNNDLLTLTQPQIIKGIYKQYLQDGGSRLIGTNTFSGTTIAQADYQMEHLAYELNYAGARLARDRKSTRLNSSHN